MKKQILKIILNVVMKSIDAYVASTPTQIDDAIWARLKEKIQQDLEKAA